MIRIISLIFWRQIYTQFHLILSIFLMAKAASVLGISHKTYQTIQLQSDMLPVFIKTAKNRERIVKLLTKQRVK